MIPAPPADEAELLARARMIAGRTLGELAAAAGHKLPDLTRHKGFVGELLERLLGATGASRAQPDFPGIGVELKTIPVDAEGRPQESTWVCTALLDTALSGQWAESWVRHKLRRVLWIPVVHGDLLPADRVIGHGVLWTPSTEEEATLRSDWEELAQKVVLGEIWQITGRFGRALQLRPKGADATEQVWTLDEDGEAIRDMRRGFYLRPSFTAAVLNRLYGSG